MDINLHIERLVLDGVTLTPAQQRQLQASVKTELGRLITESGLGDYLHSRSSVHRLTPGPIEVAEQPDPTQLGTQIAQALYQGIGS
ncbi:hypothetical protein [Pseudanabaena sp. FACHB-2040]|uniref:hypothetical protein n=1 Tax=Pseudanabaena sp. FACHB-2040 TaxID=2692859 RepID=UPI00168451A8|nr:hypothetical protein [Pseudanabaena sp. FACHB-2040]MBD2261425.1 hypothetical protein [Pseudanabaena sp. FACHB-2040]